jgi:hypothetical protein
VSTKPTQLQRRHLKDEKEYISKRSKKQDRK